MKCHMCGEKFPANRALSGQEAPGTFLVITVVFVVIGCVLKVFGVRYWPYISFGVAGLVGVQVVVAFFDCRNPWSTCPKCDAPARVRPWSF